MAADRFGIVGRLIASAYQVEEVVAEGGFGVVYRAHHGGFRAPVALKCLKVPQHLDRAQQAHFLEQFRAEAEVLFRLSASVPAVVRPLHVDAMTTPSGAFVPFMVLEWLEGRTLDAIIQERAARGEHPLELEAALGLLEPVARGLERAHHFAGPAGDEAIVHCDVKPENVFVAEVAGERAVKILDFGVAQVQRAATQAGSGSGSFALFTPAYGAPEQWNTRELGRTGPYTDVWGLALTLTEVLVGRPVIAGDHATMLREVLDPRRRPTPRTHGARVSDAVEAVFQRALAVRPEQRYQDAGAFWTALRDAHAGRVALEVDLPSAEIPDLVPLPRKPSGAHRLDLPANSSRPKAEPASVVDLDLDDAGGDASALELDVAPGELLVRGSLAPAVPSVAPSVAQPASSLSGAVLPISGRAPVPERMPLPAQPALSPVPPPVEAATPAAGERRSSKPPALRTSAPPPERPLVRRLAPGLAVAAGSILLTLLDRVYAGATGEVFQLGPIKTSLVAALLLIGGLALVARELLFRERTD